MIIFDNVSFYYNDKIIFKNVNLKLEENKTYCLLGSNGSGKSTFLNLISGFFLPTTGEIIFVDAQKDDCGFIIQNPDDQFVSDNVLGELVFGMENKCFSPKKMKNNIKLYSKVMGIENLIHKKINELSGGQKQRVAITSILCMEQKIILLDEPTAMLDPISCEKFYSFLNSINGMYTIIIINHDLTKLDFYDELLYIKDKNCFISNKFNK